MNNQEHEFLNKELKEEFDSVLGGILDEEFNEKEEKQEETKTPDHSTSSPSKVDTDDEFDFSQFSTILDEIEEENKTETTEVPVVEEVLEVTFEEKEEIHQEPVKQETEQSFLFNLDDLDSLDDELIGEGVEENDEEEEPNETPVEQFDTLPIPVVKKSKQKKNQYFQKLK